MPKSSYISFNDDAFAAQLQTFKNAIGAYDVALGIPKEQSMPKRPMPITTATCSPASN